MNSMSYLPKHTYLYRRPGDSTGWTRFSADNARFHRQEDAVSQLALIRTYEFDKVYAVALALVWTAICIAVGVVVGVLSRNAELGVAVGAASLAAIAFIAFIIGMRF